MRRLLTISWLAVGLGAGCDRRDAGAQIERASPTLSIVSVDELEDLLARHACQAVDANGAPTRQRMGIIPGAVLLPDADSIDGLPSDKSKDLVFYCANASCRASHQAAAKAIAAGYTHVQV